MKRLVIAFYKRYFKTVIANAVVNHGKSFGNLV